MSEQFNRLKTNLSNSVKGLNQELTRESLLERLRNKAIDSGFIIYMMKLLYRKTSWSELTSIDHLKFLVKVYGFLYAFNILYKGLKTAKDVLSFHLKMRRVKNRKLENM